MPWAALHGSVGFGMGLLAALAPAAIDRPRADPGPMLRAGVILIGMMTVRNRSAYRHARGEVVAVGLAAGDGARGVGGDVAVDHRPRHRVRLLSNRDRGARPCVIPATPTPRRGGKGLGTGVEGAPPVGLGGSRQQSAGSAPHLSKSQDRATEQGTTTRTRPHPSAGRSRRGRGWCLNDRTRRPGRALQPERNGRDEP